MLNAKTTVIRSNRLGVNWAIWFALAFILQTSAFLRAQPIIPTTSYTRFLLTSPDAPTARARLGITNIFGLGSFDTNIFVITGTNITIRDPVVLTNVVLVGGIQGLTYDPNIFQIIGTNISVVDPLVLTNISLLENTLSPVVDLGSPSVSVSVDVSTSIEFRVTLTNNLAVTFTTWSDGHPVRLRVANTGSFAITFANTMYWYPNGNATQVTNDWGNGINNTFAFFKDAGVIYASDKEGVGTSGAGGVSGGGVATEVAYWSSGTALTGNTNFEYASNQMLLRIPTSGTTPPLKILDSAVGNHALLLSPNAIEFTNQVLGTITVNNNLQLSLRDQAGVFIGTGSTNVARTNDFLGIPLLRGNPTSVAAGLALFTTQGATAFDTVGNNLYVWNPADTTWHALGSVIVATNVTPASPTASVGLTAVNGTGTNYMRSDSAPPLSQAIAPEWSGAHLFDNGIAIGPGTVTNLGAAWPGIVSPAQGLIFTSIHDVSLGELDFQYTYLSVGPDLNNSDQLTTRVDFVNETNAYATVTSVSAGNRQNIARVDASTNGAALFLTFNDNHSLTKIENTLSTSTNLAKLRMQDPNGDSITLQLEDDAPSLVLRVASQPVTSLDPNAADGATTYLLDSTSTHSAGNLLDVQNGSVSKFAVDFTGSPIIPLNAVSGYVLKSDGSGRATWQPTAGQVAGGIEGSVQFNSSGAFDGSDSFIWQDTTESLTIGGADTTGPILNLVDSGGPLATLQPNAADGSAPYIFSTSVPHTSGDLFQLANDSTNRFTVDANGVLSIVNSTNRLLATGKDLIYTNAAIGGPSFYVKSGAAYTRIGLNGNLQSIISSADNSSVALTLGYFVPGGLGTMDLGSPAVSEHWRDNYLSRDLYLMNHLVWNGATNTVFDLAGNGSPEGVTTGSPGSIFRSYAGTIYAKSTGTGTTGWTALGAGGGISGLTAGIYPVATSASAIGDGIIVTSVSPNTGVEITSAPIALLAERWIRGSVTLTSDNTAITVLSSYYVIFSDNATPANRTFTLGDGFNNTGANPNAYADLELLLQFDGPNSCELLNSGNVELSADWKPTDGGFLSLIWHASSGVWREKYRYPVTGGGGGAPVGTVVNTVASAGLLAVDGTKTNGIAATLAHMTNAFHLTGDATKFINGAGVLSTPGAASDTWTNDQQILKPAFLLTGITNKLWLSDTSPYVVRIDTGGAFPINDNDRLLEINNFQTNVLTVASEGGLQLGRNTRTFWNSIADNGEALVSVHVAAGQTVNDVPFNQIYIGATNIGNMGFFDVETTTNTAVLYLGVNTPKITLNGTSGTVTASSFSSSGTGNGVVTLWDNAGTHNVTLTGPTSITTNLNVIFPAAPNNGVFLGTLTGATNLTLTQVATTGSGNVMRTRTGVFRNITIPADGWIVNRTNAATAATNVYQGTGYFDIALYTFNDLETNRITRTFAMPEAWDAGTVKFKFNWSCTNTTGDVKWWAHGKIIPDNGDPNTAWGTSVSVTDTAQTASRPLLTAATGAMTFGGTPAAGGLAIIEVYRDAGDSGDTLAGSAQLWNVNLGYTETTTEPTAW